MREKLVRCSNFEYAQLEQARVELAKKGTDRLPSLKPVCPQCGNQLDGFKISYEHLQCPSCGYQEDNLAVTAIGAFALGAIIALGAAALMDMLSEESD